MAPVLSLLAPQTARMISVGCTRGPNDTEPQMATEPIQVPCILNQHTGCRLRKQYRLDHAGCVIGIQPCLRQCYSQYSVSILEALAHIR